jgi:hypothetical protein
MNDEEFEKDLDKLTREIHNMGVEGCNSDQMIRHWRRRIWAEHDRERDRQRRKEKIRDVIVTTISWVIVVCFAGWFFGFFVPRHWEELKPVIQVFAIFSAIVMPLAAIWWHYEERLHAWLKRMEQKDGEDQDEL